MHKQVWNIWLILALLGGLALLPGGCGKKQGGGTYVSISMQEASKRFLSPGGYVIVDVRREDEYAAGHIPGAILIPNESITSKRPEELPDLKQTIYIYCRSGNRSKQACEKLAAMGYTHIIEFGGILDWPGELEK